MNCWFGLVAANKRTMFIEPYPLRYALIQKGLKLQQLLHFHSGLILNSVTIQWLFFFWFLGLGSSDAAI